MQSREELARRNDQWEICSSDELWVKQLPQGLSLVDSNKTLVDWNDDALEIDDINSSMVVQASPDIGMREAIELKQRSNQPILLVEEDELVGVLTDNELYDALLGNFKTKQVA